MAGSFALDTNIVVAYLNNEDQIRRRLAGITAYVPGIVAGEMYHGAMRSIRVADNIASLEDFLAISVVLNCHLSTARHYGEVHHALRLKGRPIPENDIWIAATALQHGLTLVTRDAHFNQVDQLLVATW